MRSTHATEMNAVPLDDSVKRIVSENSDIRAKRKVRVKVGKHKPLTLRPVPGSNDSVITDPIDDILEDAEPVTGDTPKAEILPECAPKSARLPALQPAEPDEARGNDVKHVHIRREDILMPSRSFLKPVHVALIAFAGLFAMFPVIVFWSLVSGVALSLLVVALMRSAVFWQGATRLVYMVGLISASGRETMLNGMDTLALQWDGLVERLPGDVAEHLRMPDIAEFEHSEFSEDYAFNRRLSDLRESA